MKKERATMSDEQRERVLIAEQIERAAAQSEDKGESADSSKPEVEEGLKRDESSEKVVLSLSAKLAPAAAPAPTVAPLKMNPLKASNPLKRPNVFKTAPTKSETSETKKRSSPVSAAEQLMYEEQERKRRKLEREGVSLTA